MASSCSDRFRLAPLYRRADFASSLDERALPDLVCVHSRGRADEVDRLFGRVARPPLIAWLSGVAAYY